MLIQTVMLVALGFLAASLLALLLAPALWSRAVRLTTLRIKQSLPISEEEIRADRDRMRAEYAIRMYKLETDVERATLDRARHVIDVSKRDAAIAGLGSKLEDLKGSLEEHENARRVLEQIVTTSLPRVEQRLADARGLLSTRDKEIEALAAAADRQRLALEEAATINAQKSAEIERLSNALTTRGARNTQALADPVFDAEVALRAEIEALRMKARDQAALITRLQVDGGATPEAGASKDTAASDGQSKEALLKLVRAGPIALDEAQLALEKELRAAKAKIEDQASEIARLSASVSAFESGEKTGGLKDSKIALKARLNSVEAQAARQIETIKSLRAELAASNERIALQTQHMMEEMRRIGAGTLPAAGAARTQPQPVVVKKSLVERVAESSRASGTHANGHDAAEGTPEPVAKANGSAASGETAETPAGTSDAPAERPRLLDRISRLSKA
jgi:uncharacterized coiled-coil protein SlyX